MNPNHRPAIFITIGIVFLVICMLLMPKPAKDDGVESEEEVRKSVGNLTYVSE